MPHPDDHLTAKLLRIEAGADPTPYAGWPTGAQQWDRWLRPTLAPETRINQIHSLLGWAHEGILCSGADHRGQLERLTVERDRYRASAQICVDGDHTPRLQAERLAREKLEARVVDLLEQVRVLEAAQHLMPTLLETASRNAPEGGAASVLAAASRADERMSERAEVAE